MRITVTQREGGFDILSLFFLVLFGMTVVYCYTVFRTPMIWFGGIACALSLLGFLHSEWKHSVLLRIDDTGIYDRRLGVGKIRWVDIDDVQLQVTEGNRYLCFRVHNPEPYLARLKGANRERVLYNHSLGFRGFNVDVNPVDVNLLELKKQIDARVRRRRSPRDA
jgi:hypothetical protein